MTAQHAPLERLPLFADVTHSPAPITPIRDTSPVDYLFSHMKISPAQTITELLRICFPDARTALDMTFGKGNFWDGTAHVELTGMDGNPKRARDLVGNFHALPFSPDAFDVCIFDPPFLSNGGKRSIMRAQYTAYRTVEEARESITRGCQEAWRVARLGVVIKVQDHHHGCRFVRMSDWVRATVPMEQYDELLAPNEHSKIVDPKWGQPQLSTYRAHSAYMAFRKDGPVHKRRQPAPSHIGPRCAAPMCDNQIGHLRSVAATCSPTCRKRLARQRGGSR